MLANFFMFVQAADGAKLFLFHRPVLNDSGTPRCCPVLLGRRCIGHANIKLASGCKHPLLLYNITIIKTVINMYLIQQHAN